MAERNASHSPPHLTQFLDAYAAQTCSLTHALYGCLDAPRSRLGALRTAFSAYLHHNLSPASFAEEIAQGVATGFLASRWYFAQPLERLPICQYLASLSMVTREIFTIAAPGFPIRAVDGAVRALLAILDTHRIAEVAAADGNGLSALADLYCRFLDRAHGGLRARHGIFPTPQPLASYIVRSVDVLLRTRLGKAGGLGHPGVRLLDPATGPGIFLEEALLTARTQCGGLRCGPPLQFRGYELTVPAYVIARVAIQALLDSRGERCSTRLPLYLTDALADPRPISMDPLSWELAAGFDLRDEPVSVVIGNPPFAGHSKNRGAWITALVERGRGSYYPETERNTKWLQDDYVKFLRLAQWTIEQNGEGIVGFVVNHNLLDGLTFAKLRSSLLDTFEEVFVYDLHGNARKRERCPSGGVDENIFPGVAQGIAILLLVKKAGLERRSYRADLYGSRTEKLRVLERQEVATTRWRAIPRRTYGRTVPPSCRSPHAPPLVP